MNNLEKLKELSTKLTVLQSHLTSFFQYCPDLLCIANDKGHITRLNPAWESCLGFTEVQLTALPYKTFIHPDDLDSTSEIESQLKTEGVFAFENRWRHKDGGYRTLSWTITAFIDGTCYGVARDVTKERETEVQLKNTKHELEDFFENAPIALHWANAEGIIIWANKAEVAMLGYESKESLIGKNVYEFYEDKTLCKKMFSDLINGKTINNLRTKLIRHNGELLDVVISANVLMREGKFIHTRNFTRDLGIITTHG